MLTGGAAPTWTTVAFPAVLVCGGAATRAAAGRIVAYPLFPHPGRLPGHRHPRLQHDRQERPGKYSWLGGSRGYLGMPRLTTLFWVAGVILTLWVLRNLVYSNFGRGRGHPGRRSGRQPDLRGYPAPQTLRLPHFSAFFAGVAGGLYAHLLQFINPRAFHPEIHRHAGS